MKISLTNILLLLTTFASAQDFPSYCVYLVRGDVMINTSAVKLKKLKQSELLFDNDTILIGKSSELQLVNRDAKFLRLTVPGKYNTKELDKKFQSENPPGVTSTYLKLFYEEVLDPHYNIAKFKKNSLGGAVGGAVRGSNCAKYPVDGLKTANDSLHFHWGNLGANSFTLEIRDQQDSLVYSKQIKDTQQLIKLSRLNHGRHGLYSWTVKEISVACSSSNFEFLSKQDEANLISRLKKEYPGNSLVDKLNLIDALESNGLVEVAKKDYKQLVKQNPKNTTLKKSYYLFLLRYGLYNEANNVL